MPKSLRRDRRRSHVPARPEVSDATDLLGRLFNTPQFARIVPQLPPETLHRLIQRCGLEDCGELVALATAQQLTGVFDLDLWRSDRPGGEERFDAGRFAVWLEVLVETGSASAAAAVSALDVEMVTTALAQHVRVCDPATRSTTADGDDLTAAVPEDSVACEIGGYTITPRRHDAWDAIAALLLALDAEHGEYFHRVMHGCRRLSNSGYEIDGLDELMDDNDQVIFDLALERERRRERQGFVEPSQARAFLQMARLIDVSRHTAPPANPIAAAYFRGMAVDAAGSHGESRRSSEPDRPRVPDDSELAIAAVADVLHEAGVLTRPSRALLQAPNDRASRLEHMQKHMQFVRDRDQAIHSLRHQELGNLANVIVAGCSIQGRSFTPSEATEAAVAVCNLGLENWPPQWAGGKTLPDDFLADHDLVGVFQIGWLTLYKDVGLYAARCLIEVLTTFRCDDRELQSSIDTLRTEMAKQCRANAPWRAHSHLDVLTILDSPTWAALLGLTSECPVLHAAISVSRNPRTYTIDASSFDFISENSQIAFVHEFMGSLQRRLSGH